MGIHISVEPQSAAFAKAWDSVRHAGDQEFVNLRALLPYKEVSRYPDDDDWRPLEVQRWKDAVATFDNNARFVSLLTALEHDAELYLSISY